MIKEFVIPRLLDGVGVIEWTNFNSPAQIMVNRTGTKRESVRVKLCKTQAYLCMLTNHALYRRSYSCFTHAAALAFDWSIGTSCAKYTHQPPRTSSRL